MWKRRGRGCHEVDRWRVRKVTPKTECHLFGVCLELTIKM